MKDFLSSKNQPIVRHSLPSAGSYAIGRGARLKAIKAAAHQIRFNVLPEKKKSANDNRWRIWLAVAILALLTGLAMAWKWTPLAEQLDISKITGWFLALRNNPARPVIILGAYLIGSVLLIPITVLILATALVFGPVLGTAYSLAGCLIGAVITYAIGYFLGSDLVQKIIGSRWAHFQHKLDQAGALAVATIRLLPVAPFTVVNVISGAFKLPFRQYILGSLIGLMPGILLINLFVYQMEDAFRNPGAGSLALLAGLVVISGLGILLVRRKLGKNRSKETVLASARST
jgi:uncharacterized membrane protein YdjX (TVP38/TMEM64 family)